MSKRPSKSESATHDESEIHRFSPPYLAGNSANSADDDLDSLDDFDPHNDALCWDLEAIELEEPEWDEHDFYLEDDRDEEV